MGPSCVQPPARTSCTGAQSGPRESQGQPQEKGTHRCHGQAVRDPDSGRAELHPFPGCRVSFSLSSLAWKSTFFPSDESWVWDEFPVPQLSRWASPSARACVTRQQEAEAWGHGRSPTPLGKSGAGVSPACVPKPQKCYFLYGKKHLPPSLQSGCWMEPVLGRMPVFHPTLQSWVFRALPGWPQLQPQGLPLGAHFAPQRQSRLGWDAGSQLIPAPCS